MKKVLFLLVACAMTIGFISCANTGENTAAAGDDKANTENVEQKVDMNEIIAKAKAEGANWTVDQWKDAFKPRHLRRQRTHADGQLYGQPRR